MLKKSASIARGNDSRIECDTTIITGQVQAVNTGTTGYFKSDVCYFGDGKYNRLVEPFNSSSNFIGVCVEDIPAGKTGTVIISGLATAKIIEKDTSVNHRISSVVPGAHYGSPSIADYRAFILSGLSHPLNQIAIHVWDRYYYDSRHYAPYDPEQLIELTYRLGLVSLNNPYI